MMDSEQPLSGGRRTPGVVRVGATVRRPARANSSLVRVLLKHLASQGFDGAPRYLGADEQGREIFSFIEGDVPAEVGWYGDAILNSAARLIRQFHDATTDLVSAIRGKAPDVEVVCHNDLSPCNCVFRQGEPIALIDFDMAAPGLRCMDLGYAAWLWLDLGESDIAAKEQQRRLLLFLDAYGVEIPYPVIVESILLRQQMVAAEGLRSGQEGMASWAAACRSWTLENLARR